ncbi:MAG: hypothetical protein E7318_06060 [Clostridiales bacterium]|nr:hypothetical protein [Clostridiales bacterium]
MKKLTAMLLVLCLLLPCSLAFADHVQARLNQRIATRTGPGTGYTEPGTFLSAGSYVTVISKKWDRTNEIWWVQVDFTSGSRRYRVYTGSWRMNVDLSRVPEELILRDCEVQYNTPAYAGPGSNYASMGTVYAGTRATLYQVHNGYAQIEFRDSGSGLMKRVWLDIGNTTARKDYGNTETFPQYGSANYAGWYTTLQEVYDRNRSGSTGGGGTGGGNHGGGWQVRITSTSGNARSGPGANYSHVAYVNNGEIYTVYDTAVASNGVTWFKIMVYGQYCWISSGLTNTGKY